MVNRLLFFFTPGAVNLTSALEGYVFDLPEGSIVYGDKAYIDSEIEDLLQEIDKVNLQPIRKKNTFQPLKPWEEYLQKQKPKNDRNN
jgi:hypothetical protein